MRRSTFFGAFLSLVILCLTASDVWAFRGCLRARRSSPGCHIGLFHGRRAIHSMGTASCDSQGSCSLPPTTAAGGCSGGSCGVGYRGRR